MKKLTDLQFKTIKRRYLQAVNFAISYGNPWPVGPMVTARWLSEAEPRKLSAWQKGYLAAVRDAAWKHRDAELIWCLTDVDGSVVGCFSALSEAGKEAWRGLKQHGFFVWARTFKPVVAETWSGKECDT